MTAVELVLSRLMGEESVRLLPYDDATGKPVAAPVGNLTWGIGFNLMKCGSRELFDVIARFLVGQSEEHLKPMDWYAAASPLRQSVFLDIAYNAGLGGLLGYHRMLTAAAAGDWKAAAQECTTTNQALRGRYDHFRTILITDAEPLP